MSTSTKPETDLKDAQAAMAALLKRAERGDSSVLPELRKALDADARLWQSYGDLALQAEASLGLLAAGTNLLLGESLRRKLSALKKELAGESPSPLERLLVDSVAATWLQVYYYDGLMSQLKGSPDARAKMIQQERDAAHRRHLVSIKTLATVRKLLTPALSPVDVASRLDRAVPGFRRDRESIAGTVPVSN